MLSEKQLRYWRTLSLLLVAGFPHLFSLAGDFVFDDAACVRDNTIVQKGLTIEGIHWAFSAPRFGSWSPITWLSHMFVCQAFGMRPWAHHLFSLLVHLASTWMLFRLLIESTENVSLSWLTAVIWGVHPVGVESVAWIAERKGALSALFGIWALRSYVHFARQPTWGNYIGVIALLAISLASKQMWVSFPLLAFLWDVWPLQRLSTFKIDRRTLLAAWPLLREKTAVFILVGVMMFVAVEGQSQLGAIQELPISVRLGNYFLSLALYLRDLLFPFWLCAFYPHPGDTLDFVKVLPAALVVSIITAGVLYTRDRVWFTGWFWFLIALAPVGGLVQVGVHGRADRYMYTPMIGLIIPLVWRLGPFICRLAPQLARPVAVALVASLVLISACQSMFWRDTVTLFGRCVAVTGPNDFACYNLAIGLHRQAVTERKRGSAHSADALMEQAFANYQQAVDLAKMDGKMLENIGEVFFQHQNLAGAELAFQKAIRQKPTLKKAQLRLAQLCLRTGRVMEASQRLIELANQFSTDADIVFVTTWMFSTSTNDSLRDPVRALAILRKYQQLGGKPTATIWDAQAAAFAGMGDFLAAQASAEQAEMLARAEGDSHLASRIAERKAGYQNRREYRE